MCSEESVEIKKDYVDLSVRAIEARLDGMDRAIVWNGQSYCIEDD